MSKNVLPHVSRQRAAFGQEAVGSCSTSRSANLPEVATALKEAGCRYPGAAPSWSRGREIHFGGAVVTFERG